VTIAAAFSTASAINATLFSTAGLMRDVSAHRDLPPLLSCENRRQVPVYAVIGIGLVSALLASLGSLEMLVQAASLSFLFTFGTVNGIALTQPVAHRWISLAGLLRSAAAAVVLIWQMVTGDPLVLIALAAMVPIAMVGRTSPSSGKPIPNHRGQTLRRDRRGRTPRGASSPGRPG
jgi:L-asparagine transporter-like permease